MGAQVWIRNPEFCIKEVIEVGNIKVAWDRGYLVKRGLDPLDFAHTYIGRSLPFRTVLIGEQGTAELDYEHPLTRPLAVYPTWDFENDHPDLLEEYMARPVGLSEALCKDASVPTDQRPVLGQEHRVVVVRPPELRSPKGRSFLRFLMSLIEDYSECILHMHGFWSYRSAFGYGFPAADIEPRVIAANKKVSLPNGREVPFEKAQEMPQWVKVVGMKPSDLDVPRNRCMFNIRAALWAAEHFGDNFNFRVRGGYTPDLDAPLADAGVPEAAKSRAVAIPAAAGDKIACDSCSLARTCKYFRDGSVCSLPGSESAPLARLFKTRDSDRIIDGLGELLSINADRLNDGRSNEELDGEINADVSNLVNQMFKQGVTLAKLLNPSLRSVSPAAAAAAGAAAGAVAALGAASPNALMAAIVAKLEAKGYTREEITSDLVLREMQGPAAIDVRSVDG